MGHVQVMVHVTLRTIFGEGEDVGTVEVSYIIVDVISPYNIIIGRPIINALGVVTSTMYLILKYQIPSRRVETVIGDQHDSQ